MGKVNFECFCHIIFRTNPGIPVMKFDRDWDPGQTPVPVETGIETGIPVDPWIVTQNSIEPSASFIFSKLPSFWPRILFNSLAIFC